MPNATDKINIDVVLADQTATSVQPSYYPKDVAVTLPGSPGRDGGQGPEGIQGPEGSFTPHGLNGDVQFKTVVNNTEIDFSGVSSFNFNSDNNFLTITGGGILLDNASIHLTSTHTDSDYFSIKDNNLNLLRIDSDSKKVTFTENVGLTEYYLGIGLDTPEERVHVGNGNLRVDGNVIISGNLLPLLSGISDIGSTEAPFRDVYLEGETIHFVNTKAKITSDKEKGVTISQTIINEQGQEQEQSLLTAGSGGVEFFGSITGDISYSNITDGFLFTKVAVPPGSKQIDISFPQPELTYYPQVIANLEHTNDPDEVMDIYGVSVQSVTTAGFTAIFTSPVNYQNFYLTAFISPKYNQSSLIS